MSRQQLHLNLLHLRRVIREIDAAEKDIGWAKRKLRRVDQSEGELEEGLTELTNQKAI